MGLQHVSDEDALVGGGGLCPARPFSSAVRDSTPHPLRAAPLLAPVASPDTGAEGEPSALASASSMLAMVLANGALRVAFHRLKCPFPTGVAGVAMLFAAAIALRGGGQGAENFTQIPKSYATYDPACRLGVGGVETRVRHASISEVWYNTALLQDTPGRYPRRFPILSIPLAMAAARAARGETPLPPVPPVCPGARLRAAANSAKLVLAVAGGWLVNVGVGAAVVAALSPPPPSSSPQDPASPANEEPAAAVCRCLSTAGNNGRGWLFQPPSRSVAGCGHCGAVSVHSRVR